MEHLKVTTSGYESFSANKWGIFVFIQNRILSGFGSKYGQLGFSFFLAITTCVENLITSFPQVTDNQTFKSCPFPGYK